MEEFRFTLPTEQCVTIDNLRVSMLTEHGQNREGYSLQSLHTHSYVEIFICTEGVLTIVSEKGQQHAIKGCGILVPPHVLHHLMPSEAPMQRMTFGLSMTRTAGGSRDLYTHFMKRFCGSTPVGLTGCTRLRELAASVETVDEMQAAFGIAALLAELYHCVDESAVNLPADMPDGGDLQRIIKLEGLINTYFDTDIDVPKLAEMLYISERQLARIVKRHYGSTLRRVITDRRLRVAAEMLAETDKSAEAIGGAVGFGTKSSFYREFRQSYGITPMEYRRLYGRYE
jgi:AraC-like DNA-binding protein